MDTIKTGFFEESPSVKSMGRLLSFLTCACGIALVVVSAVTKIDATQSGVILVSIGIGGKAADYFATAIAERGK